MIITIARQCGCEAAEVGRLLSEHYKIPFYTRKNLMEMAARRGLTARMEDFFDEHPVDELLFSISSYGEVRSAVTDRPLRTLAEMIGTEDCIIIGRCGNYIFRERKDLVSVFLGGDLKARIANIERDERLSHTAAEEFVERFDQQRAAYHKYYTDLTWGAAEDYDLCLDSIRLGVDGAAEIIERYAERVL